MRSLRTRLALISTLVSGVAIVGVSALAWYYMVQAVKQTVDARLEGIAGRLIRDMHPRANWDTYRERVSITYEDDIREGNLILRLVDAADDEVVFSSSDEFEEFQADFPEEFTRERPLPKARPEWGGGMGAPLPGEKGRSKGKGLRPPPKGNGPGGLQGRPGAPVPRSGPPDGDADGESTDDAPLDPDELDRLLAELDAPPEFAPLPSRDPFEPIGGERVFGNVSALGKEWRAIMIFERGYSVMAAIDLTRSIVEVKRLERGFLVGIPIAIFLIGIGGWFIAERALRPIRKIAETASHISAKDLGLRIEESGHPDPEIENMIGVLNGMMDRLEQGFSHANRFSADVSHELKTPIAVMQAEIETALTECEPETAEESRLLVLREEANRLKSITRSLMLLSQADVGELIRVFEPVDLTGEVRSMVEDAEILAEENDVRIESDIAEEVGLRGDAVLLRQALMNLVNNAIKYNVKGGFVRIELGDGEGEVRISVENSGPGISEEGRKRIFDRFYRGDRARTRGIDGYGLGLSLAEAVIEGHGGTIELEKADAESTRFVARFPEKG